ncbi:MAG TPA: outer membrane lipoprotein chaperone LolA [Gammaproteobacteria bacterium]|nr:outer membrane lipoprotein chaperone LolA [Gammaproteobacteria bacterium]
MNRFPVMSRPRLLARLFGLCLAATLLAPNAFAASDGNTAVKELEHFYHSVHTLHARFRQVLLDSNMQVKQRARGEVWIRRPGSFRWRYDAPHKRLIVSDGKTVKLYDVDLSQITVRPVSKALTSTPAMLLAGGAALDKRFQIKDLGKVGKARWVELKPKTQDTDFKSIRLGFRDGRLAVMELHDTFDETTRIRFSDVSVNQPIKASRFQLQAPPGVEVVGG